ncbi:MAG: class I SAM-dependent methyltransferase [Planctomycetaceae bacterium]|jgi:cyclopropane fatty-acyl-phospholipid synthase-like methyltransferase|nr:class I SAM-dependent methyltransferase [Planctomycetaceae bacterium]MBT6156644.1 class I SAM-dependent methyltransferase [Planctomycetaceae bacterium]MBT6486396.1 class I SAM-dependent methyltransferase [Planctomycetaceae bacterium]MBT6496219.1 class I SAM-dependent methyltransferase [Planctomycetaceae bacterium]
MAEKLPPKQRFAAAYETVPPWEIYKPRQQFVDVADLISGRVLDAGCGTGDNALFFAERGQEVVGVDFVEVAIERARAKATSRNLDVSFLVKDALQLSELDGQFDSVIDCGLFHVFAIEHRPAYIRELSAVTKSGGRLFLLCFSDKEPGSGGPKRLTQDEIRATFATGWEVESITEARFEDRPDLTGSEFTKGGPLAWFCIIRRI